MCQTGPGSVLSVAEWSWIRDQCIRLVLAQWSGHRAGSGSVNGVSDGAGSSASDGAR